MDSLLFDLIAGRSSGGSLCGRRMYFEPHFFLVLQKADDLEEVPSLRISGRAEHPHQALRRVVSALRQFVKAHCGVNVVAQHGLARLDVSR